MRWLSRRWNALAESHWKMQEAPIMDGIFRVPFSAIHFREDMTVVNEVDFVVTSRNLGQDQVFKMVLTDALKAIRN